MNSATPVFLHRQSNPAVVPDAVESPRLAETAEAVEPLQEALLQSAKTAP
jgi:hypothetical protein